MLGAVALGVTAITGAGWAAGSATGASVARPGSSVPRPSFSKLSASQVKARSSGKRERVVVVFADQLRGLPANRAHRRAREAAAASMQAPLIAQLKQVGATHLTALSLLNAVAATMPAAEAQALRHVPGVKEVVPTRPSSSGRAANTTPRRSPPPRCGSGLSRHGLPTGSNCAIRIPANRWSSPRP